MDEIQKDKTEAMKEGNSQKLGILRILISNIRNAQIEKGDDLDENEEAKVALKLAKKVKESIEEFEAGGRNDLAQNEREQLQYLEKYLPEQMSEDQIEEVVEQVIVEVDAAGMKDMGRVMGAVMGKVQGKADGSVVKEVVKKKLS